MIDMAVKVPNHLEPAPDRSRASVPDTAVVIEELVHTYYDAVHRLALAILADSADAEDAVQETFIAAARAVSKFRGDASMKTWLFAIAVNQCRGMLRQRKRRQTLLAALQKLQLTSANPQSPESSVVLSEAQAELAAAVNQLKEKHRLPIILRYVNGLTAPEIARVLKVNEGTVYSRLHYARDNLRKSLAEIK